MKFVKGESTSETSEPLPPRFRDDGLQCIFVAEGSTATIVAELYNLTEDIEIIWSKDGGAPIAPDRRRRLQVVGNSIQLALDDVRRSDAGMYTVTAQSISGGGVTTRDVELRVSDGADDDEPPAFLRRLNDQRVKVGTRTRLLVEIRSGSELELEWYKNEERVHEGERYRFVNEGGFHCIDVAPLTPQDLGRWTVTARNASGQASSSCHLNVLVPKTYKAPEFLEELRALLTEQGTVSLECKVVGVPTPSLRWFKDGKEIRAGDVFALTANPDDPTSLGVYVCEAVNCMGKAVSSSRVHVVGKDETEGLKSADSHVPSGPPPIFVRDLQDESIKIGDPLLLSCQVSVPPWPKLIQWYNSEGRIEDDAPRYRQMADGVGGYMLEVKPTEAADQGEWKCVATSENGVISISTCNIKMTIPKHFRKPRFMDTLKAVLTEEGLVSFECKVVGSPTPLLRWFKDGQELKPGDVYQLTGTNSLGSYCCIARNCMGEARSSAELTVEDIQSQLSEQEREQLTSRSLAPKFIQGLNSSEVKINESHKFTVQVSVTTPLPSLSWYRDDQPVDNEPEKYLVHRENLGVCHLEIRPVELNDQAEWKCVASNEFGHSVTTCFLKLIIPKHFKKPKFLECLRAVLSEEGAVNLECKVIGVPQPVLKWYKDGIELKPGDIHRITSGEDGTCCLGTYTCEARNCMGTVASSASLLGFEDQQSRAQAQRMELARQPSLSTIHEERTSQLYDTAGDQSITIADHGEVSFSFDGKEVSVSLYETPDLTEEEAIQIVEMYADQLSEHFSEHSIIELPPLRFVKESSNSGNLLMEAVVVDVTDDYFQSAEEDLRTEADIEEILSVTHETSVTSEKLKIELTSSGDGPKRPPRKSDSLKSNSYYSLSKNLSIDSEKADESLAGAAELDTESYGDYESAMSFEKSLPDEERAYQVAAITETTSLPGDDDDRRPLTPRTTHEIGSDLRVNRSESQELRRSSKRRSSQSSDEMSKDGFKRGTLKKCVSLDLPGSSYQRDIQGEEGDGLVIDPKVAAAKLEELKKEEAVVIKELQHVLDVLQGNLLTVEEKLLIQSSLKSSSAAANRSSEVLNSISQPIKDIQTVFKTFEEKEISPEISIVELIAPPIFELQQNLSIVEKCFAIEGKGHTLIQKTCSNIIELVGPDLENTLDFVERITLLEKELDRTKASGRMTPSKITQEVCITIKEIQSDLNKMDSILKEKLTQQMEKSSSSEETPVDYKDISFLDRFIDVSQNLRQGFLSLEKTLAYEDSDQMYPDLGQAILDRLADPILELTKEFEKVENQVARYTGERSLEHEIRLTVLDRLKDPLNELLRGFNTIKKQNAGDRHSGIISLNVLESFINPTEEIIQTVEKIKNHVELVKTGTDSMNASQEVVKEVLETVSDIVFINISQAIDDLLFNIETAEHNIKDTTVLEALRQLSTLQKDLSTTLQRTSEIKTEETVTALENLAEPLQLLNNAIMNINPAQETATLDVIVSLLNILEESIIIDDQILKSMDLCIIFTALKGRIIDVRENICGLTEHGTVPEPLAEDTARQDNVVFVLEEFSPTVVSKPLVGDTVQTINAVKEQKEKSAFRSSLEPLLPQLQTLQVIVDNELLIKPRTELTMEDRINLQKHVVPLEETEDYIIIALDEISAQTDQSDEAKLPVLKILEHLQYNVAVMHQQIVDETQLLEVMEHYEKPTFEDLKDRIAALQNLMEPIEEESIPTSEVKHALVQNICSLEEFLVTFSEAPVLESYEHHSEAAESIHLVSAAILESIESIKNGPLFESREISITNEEVNKIKEFTKSLMKLEKTLENVEEYENQRKQTFLSLKEPLLQIANLLDAVPDDIKIRLFPIHEPLRNAIEIISLEMFNEDIKADDFECLRETADMLQQLKSCIPMKCSIHEFASTVKQLMLLATDFIEYLEKLTSFSLRHINFALIQFAHSIQDIPIEQNIPSVRRDSQILKYNIEDQISEEILAELPIELQEVMAAQKAEEIQRRIENLPRLRENIVLLGKLRENLEQKSLIGELLTSLNDIEKVLLRIVPQKSEEFEQIDELLDVLCFIIECILHNGTASEANLEYLEFLTANLNSSDLEVLVKPLKSAHELLTKIIVDEIEHKKAWKVIDTMTDLLSTLDIKSPLEKKVLLMEYIQQAIEAMLDVEKEITIGNFLNLEWIETTLKELAKVPEENLDKLSNKITLALEEFVIMVETSLLREDIKMKLILKLKELQDHLGATPMEEVKVKNLTRLQRLLSLLEKEENLEIKQSLISQVNKVIATVKSLSTESEADIQNVEHVIDSLSSNLEAVLKTKSTVTQKEATPNTQVIRTKLLLERLDVTSQFLSPVIFEPLHTFAGILGEVIDEIKVENVPSQKLETLKQALREIKISETAVQLPVVQELQKSIKAVEESILKQAGISCITEVQGILEKLISNVQIAVEAVPNEQFGSTKPLLERWDSITKTFKLPEEQKVTYEISEQISLENLVPLQTSLSDLRALPVMEAERPLWSAIENVLDIVDKISRDITVVESNRNEIEATLISLNVAMEKAIECKEKENIENIHKNVEELTENLLTIQMEPPISSLLADVLQLKPELRQSEEDHSLLDNTQQELEQKQPEVVIPVSEVDQSVVEKSSQKLEEIQLELAEPDQSLVEKALQALEQISSETLVSEPDSNLLEKLPQELEQKHPEETATVSAVDQTLIEKAPQEIEQKQPEVAAVILEDQSLVEKSLQEVEEKHTETTALISAIDQTPIEKVPQEIEQKQFEVAAVILEDQSLVEKSLQEVEQKHTETTALISAMDQTPIEKAPQEIEQKQLEVITVVPEVDQSLVETSLEELEHKQFEIIDSVPDLDQSLEISLQEPEQKHPETTSSISTVDQTSQEKALQEVEQKQPEMAAVIPEVDQSLVEESLQELARKQPEIIVSVPAADQILSEKSLQELEPKYLETTALVSSVDQTLIEKAPQEVEQKQVEVIAIIPEVDQSLVDQSLEKCIAPVAEVVQSLAEKSLPELEQKHSEPTASETVIDQTSVEKPLVEIEQKQPEATDIVNEVDQTLLEKPLQELEQKLSKDAAPVAEVDENSLEKAPQKSDQELPQITAPIIKVDHSFQEIAAQEAEHGDTEGMPTMFEASSSQLEEASKLPDQEKIDITLSIQEIPKEVAEQVSPVLLEEVGLEEGFVVIDPSEQVLEEPEIASLLEDVEELELSDQTLSPTEEESLQDSIIRSLENIQQCVIEVVNSNLEYIHKEKLIQEMEHLAQLAEENISESGVEFSLLCEMVCETINAFLISSYESSVQEEALEKLENFESLVESINASQSAHTELGSLLNNLRNTMKDCKKSQINQEIVQRFSEYLNNLIESCNKYKKKEPKKLLTESISYTLPLIQIDLQETNFVNLPENEMSYINNSVDMLSAIESYINTSEKSTNQMIAEVSQFNESNQVVSQLDIVKHLQLLFNKSLFCLKDVKNSENEEAKEKMQNIQVVSDGIQKLVQSIAAIKYKSIDRERIVTLQRALYPLQIAINDLVECRLDESDYRFLENLTKIFDDIDCYVNSMLNPQEKNLHWHKGQILIFLDILNKASNTVSEKSEIKELTKSLNVLVESLPDTLQQLEVAYTEEVKTEFAKKVFVTIRENTTDQHSVDLKESIQPLLVGLDTYCKLSGNMLTEEEINLLISARAYLESLSDEKVASDAQLQEMLQNNDSPVAILVQNILDTTKELKIRIDKETVSDQHEAATTDQDSIIPKQKLTETIENEEIKELVSEEIAKVEIQSEKAEEINIDDQTMEKSVAGELISESKLETTDLKEHDQTLPSETQEPSASVQEPAVLTLDVEGIAEEMKGETQETEIKHEALTESVTEQVVEKSEVELKGNEGAESIEQLEMKEAILEISEDITEKKEAAKTEELKHTEEIKVETVSPKISDQPEIKETVQIIKEEIQEIVKIEEIKETIEETKEEIKEFKEIAKVEDLKPMEELTSGGHKTEQILVTQEAEKASEIVKEEEVLVENVLPAAKQALSSEDKQVEQTETIKSEPVLDRERTEEENIEMSRSTTEIEKDKDSEVSTEIKPEPTVEKIDTNVITETATEEKADETASFNDKVIEECLDTAEKETVVVQVVDQSEPVEKRDKKTEIILETKQAETGEQKVLVDKAKEEEDKKVLEEILSARAGLLGSFEVLQTAVNAVKDRPLPMEKRTALNDLEKSIVQEVEELNTAAWEYSSVEESSAVSVANTTLNNVINCVQDSLVDKESAEVKVFVTVEDAKKSIETLRLTVVVVDKDSKIKLILENFEKTLKNVVNLIEGIPTDNELKTKLLSDVGTLNKSLEGAKQYISENKIKTAQILLKDADDLIKNITILHDTDYSYIQFIEDCIQEINSYLEASNSQQKIKEWSKKLEQKRQDLNDLLNEFSEDSSTKMLIEKIQKVIESLIVAEEITIEKIECPALQSLQNSLQYLQEAASSIETDSASKIQKSISADLQRPLITLQFIAGSVLEEKKLAFSKDDLHVIELTNTLMVRLKDLVNNLENKHATEVLDECHEYLKESKIVIASINQESQVKDFLEPLGDLTKIVEKVHDKVLSEKERIRAISEGVLEDLRTSLEKLEASLKEVSSDISSDAQSEMVNELNESIQTIFNIITTINRDSLSEEDVRTLENINDTLESLLKGVSDKSVTWMKGLRDITSSMRSMKETSDDYIRFTLKRATMEDVGTYCILAKNRHGCDRAFFTVRLRPRARSETPTRTSEGASYQERYCFQDVPGPIPGPPVVADTGRNWVSLSWGKPEHRGAAPVVAYRVEAWQRGGEGARWQELGMSGHNSYDAFNLKPGGEYQFRITPRNRYGWGESVQSGVIVVGRPNALPEFTRILPGQLKSLLGTEISLECEVRGDPPPTIRWFKDSYEIFEEDDDRYTMSQTGKVCSLNIKSLQDSDSGRFMCEATNTIGRVSTFARLSVVKDPKILTADEKLRTSIFDFGRTTELPPQFTMRLRDRRVQVNYPVRLTCQIAGCPEPTISWFKNGQEIMTDSRHSFWTDGNFHTLEISETNLEDSGIYSVSAQNQFGSVSCRCNLVIDKGIKVYISPAFSEDLEPSQLEVQEGGEIRLSARVQAYPIVGIMWYRDGVRLRPSRRSVMTLSYDGRLELSLAGVTSKDAGVYTCVANNEIGRAETSARVVVIEKASKTQRTEQVKTDIPYSEEPKFLKKPLSTVAFEGDNVIILCEVIGDPKPEVVWLRDFLKPDYYRDAAHFHRVGDGPEYRLEIPNAKLDFTGTYTVYAKNCNGDAKAIISLQIKVRDPIPTIKIMDRTKIGEVKTIPKIAVDLKDIRCCDGDAAAFECKIEGTPPPEIRWERGGKLVHLGGDFNAEFDGETARLCINQVYPEDEGEYTCVAYNELGKAYTSACLIVDLPEEKDNLLKEQLIPPPGIQNTSSPDPSPRVTPKRSISPRPRHREIVSTETQYRRIRATAPKFYAYPHNKVAEEGETVRFQCSVAGHPDPWVTWEKDGDVLNPSARHRITERDDLRTLEISDVRPTDTGTYKIILENDVGRVEASAKLDVIRHRIVSARGLRARSLSPRAAPIYTKSLIGGSARLGSRARLYCDINTIPTPSFRWYKDNALLDDTQKYRPSYDGKVVSLEIDNVSVEDAGLYTCEATNKNGSTETHAHLDVHEDEYLPPEVIQSLPKRIEVTESSPVTLQVQAVGTQPFDVVWMKDGCILPDTIDFRQSVSQDGTITLRLQGAYAQDSGDYRCEIYNVYGDAFSTSHLDVKERKPEIPQIEFMKHPNPVMAVEGGNASFCVRVRSTGKEQPDVEWEVAGIPVVRSEKFKVEVDGDVNILHIHGVSAYDAGPVKCTAWQRWQQLASIDGDERVSGGERTTSCSTGTDLTVLEQCDGGGAGAVDFFATGTGQRPFSMDDYEEEGQVEEPAMLLRAPQNTTALAGDRVLLKVTYMGRPEPSVKWTRASRVLKNDERTSITSGDGVSCLLLQDITTDDSGKYDVSVENMFGADYSYASVSVEGPPDPPSGNPCITADLDNVTVAWSSSPYDGGRIVTGYAVEYSMVGSDIWTTAVEECHSLSYTVRGLQPGGKYMFRVRALNVHGYSRPSLESDIVQLEEHNECSTFEPRIVSVEPGPEFRARYEVAEELGKGRFGVVHKVVDKESSQKLAGKFIKCRTSRDRDKVQDEIDIMNLLRHQKLLQLAAAFESPREMIMVMEYISGGELFERVVADDFTLTEKDCILFMRQICEGVAYMHTQNIVHLDLKPENIMCHTRTSHEIKIIDFGLAQKLDPLKPVRVLFGTPEFIPPEIISYEPIGVESDMWSIGVICYVLLSGLSPFMGDNDSETFANITRADYDFDDEAFSTVSQNARDFISALLVKRKEDRLSAEQCLKHVWLDPETHQETVVLSTDKLKKFIIRRKWQVNPQVRQVA